MKVTIQQRRVPNFFIQSSTKIARKVMLKKVALEEVVKPTFKYSAVVWWPRFCLATVRLTRPAAESSKVLLDL